MKCPDSICHGDGSSPNSKDQSYLLHLCKSLTIKVCLLSKPIKCFKVIKILFVYKAYKVYQVRQKVKHSPVSFTPGLIFKNLV